MREEPPPGSHVGAGYAHVVLDGGLHVTLLFGRPTGDAATELVALLDAEPFDAPRLSLFDATAVGAIEPEAFEVITAYQNRRRDDLARVVARQAIVTPRGLPGAIVSGYHAVFAFSYPVELFADRAAALAYLGREDAGPAIDQLAAAAATPVVQRVRDLLAGGLAIGLAEAARRLGVSDRSLQRHLQAANTSFLDELQAARIARAKRLLLETDHKLTAIALDIGMASVQSFSTLFRRVTGETPSGFRARARRSASG